MKIAESEIKNEAAIRAEEDAKLKTQISEINENDDRWFFTFD